MRKICRIIFLTLVALASCKTASDEKWAHLRPGDLLFQSSESTAFSDAIVSATANDSLSFSHVGIYAEVDGAACVIEAVPKKGVTITPLDSFIAESTLLRAMRIDFSSDSTFSGADASNIVRRAVKEALKMKGKPYDRRFAPGDSAIYCSELVQIAFRRAAGKEVFPSSPMNFLAPDSTMPQYWIDLFEKEGYPIPQGAPGTNPTSLSASPLLKRLPITTD